MTVAALTPALSYTENGVTLAFAVPFRYLDPTHLLVVRTLADGTQATLTYGVDWSATAGLTDAGGTLTLVASVSGSTLTIQRKTPRAQATDYVANDRFPAETHESTVDRAMLIDQEQDVDLARALLFPIGESGAVLPSAASRLGKFLGFSGVTGLPLLMSAVTTDATLRADLFTVNGASLIKSADGNTLQSYVTGQSSGPSTWSSFTTVYSYRTVAMGDGAGNFFPTSAMFGGNAVSCPQAFVATIRIPATANANNHGAAIAGYAWSDSPTKGGVGLFGGSVAGAAGVSVWGGNTVSSNTPWINPANGTGKDNCTVYGWEFDFNLKKVGAAAANFALLGIYMAGDSEAAPAGGLSAAVRAIDIDSYGITQTPRLKWNEAFFTRDGAASTALSLGTTGTGNNVGSQPIVMRSRDSGGVAGSSSITADPTGNLVISANAGAVVTLLHGATEMLACIPGVGTRIQTALRINGVQVLGPRATGWSAVTGTISRATLNTGTATLANVAQALGALLTDLTTSGPIGP